MRRLILVFILFVQHALPCPAQEKTELSALREFDYSRADSFALHTIRQKNQTYPELAHALTDGLSTEQEKYRAVFRWITENIKYNYGQKSTEAAKAYKTGKAVCIGYSTLLKEMCEAAGLECELVRGWSKADASAIGHVFDDKDNRHAWNMIKLNGQWYPCDVTWASGYFDHRRNKFRKEFKDHFFLCEPHTFVSRHYPDDPKWQLLDKPVKKSVFNKSPVLYQGYEENGLSGMETESGQLRAGKKGDFKVSVQEKKPGTKYSLLVYRDTSYEYIPAARDTLQKQAQLRSAYIPAGPHEIILYTNGKPVAGYLLQVPSSAARVQQKEKEKAVAEKRKNKGN